MSWIALLVALAAGFETGSVHGRVTDPAGRPVAGALVVAENVEADQFITTRTQPDGAFALTELAPGLTGIFAYADGFAFGGFSATVTPGPGLPEQTIVLGPPVAVSGKIAGYKDKATEGARIVRVALLGSQKVSIPLDKLQTFGVDLPVSREKGRFEVKNLPSGVPIALKVAHPDYPVQAFTGITAGDSGVKAVLTPGVLVQGNSLLRAEDRAVAHVEIKITNAQPPHESVTVRSDASGRYTVRLKPGVYTVDAKSQSYRSAGLQRITVSGERTDEKINLFMMPAGTIAGEVRSAVSGEPVAAARLVLLSSGNPAGVAYTDAAGHYRFHGASGVNKVYLADASGHVPGETRSMEVAISGGQDYEMPIFWVMPASPLEIEIVDDANAPVPGAVVTLLSPPSFGWLIADSRGIVSLPVSSIPEDRIVAGLVQHPRLPQSGLFAIPYDSTDPHVAQLAPVGVVRGRVVNEQGEGLAGMVVVARLLDPDNRPSLILWQTLSRRDGSFEWSGAPANVRQRCEVFSSAGGEGIAGPVITVESGRTADAGSIRVNGASPSRSAYGTTLTWQNKPATPGPAVVLYIPASETAVATEALLVAQRVLSASGATVALMVPESEAITPADIPTYHGSAPAEATTYVIDAAGKVVLETFGLPPPFALQQLEPRPGGRR